MISVNNSGGKNMMLIINMLLVIMTNAYDLQSQREVLLFAYDKTDTMLLEQQNIFSADLDGMTERDIVVRVLIKGRETIGKKKNLQKNYNPEMKPFMFILIGKDGGEKFRSEKPVTTAELFAIIDAMPMRRAEQNRKRNE